MIAELFAGPGGWSQGLTMLGRDPRLAAHILSEAMGAPLLLRMSDLEFDRDVA